ATACRQVVVAASEHEADDAIAGFAETEGVALFRGRDADVAGRACDCCAAFGFDSFVRISGDSPFMPPELIDRAVGLAHETGADVVSNVFPRSYPAGASVEVIRVEALWRAHADMSSSEREHVTTHFYQTADDWRIVTFSAPDAEANRDIRLTVDTHAELDAARELIRRLMPAPEMASLDDVVALRRSLQAAA